MYVLNILLAFTFCISCNAAFVDTLKKCDVKDDICMNELNQQILTEIAKSGIPELEIPAVDPLPVKDFKMTVIDAVTVTIVEGVVKGLKNCQFKKFHADLTKKTGTINVVCNITMKGHIKFSGSSPVIQSLTGKDSIEGQGTGKIKAEKVNINLNFPYYLMKHDDGEIYLRWPSGEIKYKYDVGKVTLAAEKIYLGKDDITSFVVGYFNENWKTLLERFGDKFVDTAMNNYLKLGEKFFDGVPASKLITTDLTPYL